MQRQPKHFGDDLQRWELARGMLHDPDTASVADRVAACLVLLYAQSPARIVEPATRSASALTSLALRLRALGFDPRADRNTPLLQLAAEIPPVVLADMLGLHIGTATKWAHEAAGNWNNYAAARANAKRVVPPRWASGMAVSEPCSSRFWSTIEVVVSLRSRRLETLLGVPLETVTAAHLQSLVVTGTQESFDLDYKRDHYGNSDAERRKLAGDVAALANTAGGIIILGIDEDDQARAVEAPGVVVSDAEIARIRQIVAALVAPIPTFDVVPVFQDEEQAHTNQERALALGFIVIAVPRSPQAPHAVLVNDALRFPKRNGSTTRYLSEPELAAAYRDRLAGRDAQARRVEEIERDALARLDTQEHPWIVVSLVPDVSGDLAISQKAYRDFQQAIVQTRVGLFNGSTYTRAWTGRRRLLADGSRHDSPLARWGSLDLHTDGAGVYAIPVADLTKHREQWMQPDEDSDRRPPVQLVDDESVVIGILSGLFRLAEHARDRAAVGGSVLLRAQLHPVSPERPTQIGHTRNFGGRDSRRAHSLTEPPLPAETSASVDDIAAPTPDLVAVACRLADEIGQAFGVPEMGQLSPAGAIRRRYWNRGLQTALVKWAGENNIPVTDETLDQ